ncbi:hypothetical protein HF1_07980 [Mycoplasma haemofelis str. Langford 1]|uniref:Uncharacterized protein n=1 Tax=Mycoplasma haemofelis (strain Langford 1) TaxID=941640 RepID=E8ZI35_MYCHL|nr:hypothetical protein [Mycoplasma haemofelis]CBY92806.1 hypothetical protein HF1_07980 [Mycoplasma haemofelis str. Langford 1]
MNKTAIFSAAGVGAAGAGGYGTYSLLKEKNPPSVSFQQRIDTKKRVILETSTNAHDAVWTEIAKEYKNNGNIEGIPKDDNAKEKLKQHCQRSNDSTSNKEQEFEQYKTYCTRENLITKLSTTSKPWNTSKEESKWEAAKSTYSSSGDGDLLIPKTGGSISKTEVTKKHIMDHCEEISTKPFVKNEDADYKRGEKWCLVTNG